MLTVSLRLTNNQLSIYHMKTKENPIHPGLILRAEIEARGLSVTDAANLLKITRTSMSMVLNGRAGISPALAIKIEHYLGGSAQFWADLQTTYELNVARKNLILS